MFAEYQTTKNLKCINDVDKFSVSNLNAKLEYPIGLTSKPEMDLYGTSLRNIGAAYWTMSPHYQDNSHGAHMVYVNDDGGFKSFGEITGTRAIRPVISLKPEIEYTDGDGTKNNPYIIDTSS